MMIFPVLQPDGLFLFQSMKSLPAAVREAKISSKRTLTRPAGGQGKPVPCNI